VLTAVLGCAKPRFEVTKPEPPPIDYDGDGKIGFSDLERGYPQSPQTDFSRDFSEHMDRQSKDYRERRD
jgi:hypothetical protein